MYNEILCNSITKNIYTMFSYKDTLEYALEASYKDSVLPNGKIFNIKKIISNTRYPQALAMLSENLITPMYDSIKD